MQNISFLFVQNMATLVNKASAPLDTVYAWVTSDLETSFTDFSLSTTFPRRELDTEPKSASLKELQLAPSATILVMPKVRSLPPPPAVRRTQPITKRPKFLQQPMSNCYNGYMVNNNNI